MQYHSFTRIWVRIVLLFHPFRASFLFLQGQWPFSNLTTVDDCLFHGIYQFPHRPRVWALIRIAVTIRNAIPSLRIFTIWRVVGWQRYMRRPPRMRMQNGPPLIIDWSSPGGGLRGGLFHKCSGIYTPPPKTAPYQGMLNRYVPSQETPWCWQTRACPIDPWLGGGGWGVVSWMGTMWHGDSNTPQKTTKYITWRTFLTRAPPPQKNG